MTTLSVPAWKEKSTEETRQVEDVLRKSGFDRADAYRYNPASIRVRVIDERFDKLANEQRDAMVEAILEQLPERTQADIISLFTFAPAEIEQSEKITREFLLNAEFEDPSPSML